jgi:hypothetical protein
MDPTKEGPYFYEGLDISLPYEPFYIGKGHGYRDMVHLQDYRLKGKTYLYNKLNKLIDNGIEPMVVRLYENLTEKESFDKEILLIEKIGKKYKGEGTLTNIVDGGEGVTGLVHTKESREKMSLKGENHPNWGKKLKDSTKKKISEKLKANNPMKNPEVAEKVRQQNLGRDPWNKGKSETRPEVIKKLSEKKKKYRNIKATSKETGEVFELNDTKEAMEFVGKTHRMIMIYFEKGESKDYYWSFDKDD